MAMASGEEQTEEGKRKKPAKRRHLLFFFISVKLRTGISPMRPTPHRNSA